MSRIEVTVSADHIENGAPKGRCECPVALALKDCGWGYVDVWHAVVFASRSGGESAMYSATLPAEARTFIERFDAGAPVAPFAFVLEMEPDA